MYSNKSILCMLCTNELHYYDIFKFKYSETDLNIYKNIKSEELYLITEPCLGPHIQSNQIKQKILKEKINNNLIKQELLPEFYYYNFCSYSEINKLRKIRKLFNSDKNEELKIKNEEIQELKMNLFKIKNQEHRNLQFCFKQNCKGFIDEFYKCIVCNFTLCLKCNEMILEIDHHICLDDDINTYNLIKKDSKACPKCKIFIQKISGCNQMFCTNCNTKYNWKTGNIINSGYFHNPHYIEALNNNTHINNITDLIIDGNFRKKLQNYVKKYNLNELDSDIILLSTHIESLINYINAHIITNYNYKLIMEPNRIEKIIIDYLSKDLSKDEFKNNLYNNFKYNEYIHYIKTILSNLSNELNDYLINFISNFNLFELSFKDTSNNLLSYIYCSYLDYHNIIIKYQNIFNNIKNIFNYKGQYHFVKNRTSLILYYTVEEEYKYDYLYNHDHIYNYVMANNFHNYNNDDDNKT